jgi:hypothetical protein
MLRSLDRTNSHHLALIHEATSLFRGAAYTAFDGEVPEQTEQSAIAAPYAHVTAPLRVSEQVDAEQDNPFRLSVGSPVDRGLLNDGRRRGHAVDGAHEPALGVELRAQVLDDEERFVRLDAGHSALSRTSKRARTTSPR